MIPLSNDEIKSLSLEILDEIHKFCTKNKIKYYIHAGTLLGAIRHKGFIPWDDDADVCMPRPDYEKFLSLYQNNGYYVVNYRNTRRFSFPFSKICSKKTFGRTITNIPLPYGVGVDIFPIDGFPSKLKDRERFFRKQIFIYHKLFSLAGACESEYSTKGFIRKLVKVFLKYTVFMLFPTSFFSMLIDHNSRKYRYEDSEFVGCSESPLRKKMEITERVNYEYGRLVDFEDRQYAAPDNYDAVLKSIYGSDYMSPPPESKRGCSHLDMFFWMS